MLVVLIDGQPVAKVWADAVHVPGCAQCLQFQLCLNLVPLGVQAERLQCAGRPCAVSAEQLATAGHGDCKMTERPA